MVYKIFIVATKLAVGYAKRCRRACFVWSL